MMAMIMMIANTPPGPTEPGLLGWTPAHACCERTENMYEHSSGSAPMNEMAAVGDTESRSQRKANVADLRRESSFEMVTVSRELV